MQNPFAMKRLRASLRDELTAYEQKRAVRKAAKKAKKAEKKRRKKEKKKRKRASPSSSLALAITCRAVALSLALASRRRSPSPRRRAPRRPRAEKRDGYGLRKGRVDEGRDRALGPDRGAVAARGARRRSGGRPQREQLTDEEKARRLAEFARDGAAKHEAAQVRARRDGGAGARARPWPTTRPSCGGARPRASRPTAPSSCGPRARRRRVDGGGDLADRVEGGRGRGGSGGGGGDEDVSSRPRTWR